MIGWRPPIRLWLREDRLSRKVPVSKLVVIEAEMFIQMEIWASKVIHPMVWGRNTLEYAHEGSWSQELEGKRVFSATEACTQTQLK